MHYIVHELCADQSTLPEMEPEANLARRAEQDGVEDSQQYQRKIRSHHIHDPREWQPQTWDRIDAGRASKKLSTQQPLHSVNGASRHLLDIASVSASM